MQRRKFNVSGEKRGMYHVHGSPLHLLRLMTCPVDSMLLDTISRYSEFASSSPEASDSYSEHSMSDIEDGKWTMSCSWVTMDFGFFFFLTFSFFFIFFVYALFSSTAGACQ